MTGVATSVPNLHPIYGHALRRGRARADHMDRTPGGLKYLTPPLSGVPENRPCRPNRQLGTPGEYANRLRATVVGLQSP